MKIYTKTGDEGKTGLFGGRRVWKDDIRLEAYGTVDELNAVTGVASSEVNDKQIMEILSVIQNHLFIVGGDLATPINETSANVSVPRVQNELITNLEKFIDEIENELPELKNFILPGGTKSSAILHFARTVCRRAERSVVKLNKETGSEDKIVIYLNRLSDLLFILARAENFRNKNPEMEWKPRG